MEKIMDKKLEARVARLEKLLKAKNEEADRQSLVNACSDVWSGLVFLQGYTGLDAIDEMLDLIGDVMDELDVYEDVIG